MKTKITKSVSLTELEIRHLKMITDRFYPNTNFSNVIRNIINEYFYISNEGEETIK